MKNYEALELQAKAMRMVEGTGINWKDVIRLHSRIIYNGRYDLDGYKPEECELALTIVEGKPVFNFKFHINPQNIPPKKQRT